MENIIVVVLELVLEKMGRRSGRWLEKWRSG